MAVVKRVRVMGSILVLGLCVACVNLMLNSMMLIKAAGIMGLIKIIMIASDVKDDDEKDSDENNDGKVMLTVIIILLISRTIILYDSTEIMIMKCIVVTGMIEQQQQ